MDANVSTFVHTNDLESKKTAVSLQEIGEAPPPQKANQSNVCQRKWPGGVGLPPKKSACLLKTIFCMFGSSIATAVTGCLQTKK